MWYHISSDIFFKFTYDHIWVYIWYHVNNLNFRCKLYNFSIIYNVTYDHICHIWSLYGHIWHIWYYANKFNYIYKLYTFINHIWCYIWSHMSYVIFMWSYMASHIIFCQEMKLDISNVDFIDDIWCHIWSYMVPIKAYMQKIDENNFWPCILKWNFLFSDHIWPDIFFQHEIFIYLIFLPG